MKTTILSYNQAIETVSKCNADGQQSILVRCAAMTKRVPWDYGLGHADNHAAAAEQVQNELEWKGVLHGGQMKNGAYAFVLIKN